MDTLNPSAGRLSRRGLIFAVAASATLPLLSGCGARAYPELPPPSRADTRLDYVFPHVDSYLKIRNAHTDERVSVRFMRGDRENRRAIRKLDWVFRDWRQDEAPNMDHRIYWSLATLSAIARQHGHSGEITLLSGFRTPSTTIHLQSRGIGAATKSYHMQRRAMSTSPQCLECVEGKNVVRDLLCNQGCLWFYRASVRCDDDNG